MDFLWSRNLRQWVRLRRLVRQLPSLPTLGTPSIGLPDKMDCSERCQTGRDREDNAQPKLRSVRSVQSREWCCQSLGADVSLCTGTRNSYPRDNAVRALPSAP